MTNKTIEQYAESLAHYLPSGDLLQAKSIGSSNLFKLLTGLSLVLLEVDEKMSEFKTQFYPKSTMVSFITEWEMVLGIPDDCLDNSGTIEQRAINILGCIGALGCVTEQQWIDLAKLMGFDIELRRGIMGNVFPLTLPYTLGTLAQLRNTITVIFKGIINSTSIFPMVLPYTLSGDSTKYARCIFERIKPAHIKLNFVNEM